jgi:hypothetical protein
MTTLVSRLRLMASLSAANRAGAEFPKSKIANDSGRCVLGEGRIL